MTADARVLEQGRRRSCGRLRATSGRRHGVGAARSALPATRGFTMIEVLIGVAIVAILVTVALPSYSNVTVRVNRSAAAQFMMDVANRQEQYMLDRRTYTATIGTGGLGMTPGKDVAANYTFAAAVTGNDCAGNAAVRPRLRHHRDGDGGQAKDGNLCLDSRQQQDAPAKWEF